MNVWTKRGYDIFNPVDAAGNPRKVINGEVQVWSTEVERAVYYAMVSGNLAYATKADLDADLAHEDGTVAWVVADTEALNGIYVKSGAAGSGSWTKERNLPTGPQGDIGGVAYRFDAGTADADPGTGLIRANNADLAAATELYVSKTNRYGDDLSGFLATLAGSTSSHKGYLVLTAPDSETQAAFNVMGVTDATGYVKLAVSGQGGTTAFSDAERLFFLFSRTGNAGDLNGVNPGPTGLAVLEAETKEEARTAIGALSSDAGAVTRLNLSDELAQAVASTPIFFGAAADGTNDDAAKINDAIAALPNGGVLDGLGKTYRVDSTLVLKSGVTLRNITIDFSNAAVGDTLFEAAGALGTPILLTSNVSAKATSLPLASVAGLEEGDLIRVSSTGFYASNTSARLSEMVRIKSISGTTVTLTAPLSYGYLTSQSAQVEKLNFVENIKLEGVTAFGSGVGGEQIGGLFNIVKGLDIVGCKFSDFDTVNLAIYRSAFVNIHRTRTDRAFRAGLAYGISISYGCHWVNITECSGERVRHAVTIGGTNVNRFIKVANCNAFGNLDAGFDCHPAGDHIDFIDNYVVIDPNAGGQMDGIIAQGGNTKLIGNTVIGSKQWSVFHQCLADYGNPTSIVANNIVRADSSAFYGVYVVAQGTAALQRVVIQGNSIEGAAGGVKLHALNGSVDGFSIMGNTFYEPLLGIAAAILVEADGTERCSFGLINGNSGRVAPTAAAGILLVADNSPNIQYVTVSGNSIFDGDYGCRGVNTDWINVNGNTFVSATTPVTVAGANSASANNIP